MFVVEEFMLLANEFAAKKLVSACEEVALLRKHDFPKANK
jgi:exoribonuclease R